MSTSQIHEMSRPSAMLSFNTNTSALSPGTSRRARSVWFMPAGFLTRLTWTAVSPRRTRLQRPKTGW